MPMQPRLLRALCLAGALASATGCASRVGVGRALTYSGAALAGTGAVYYYVAATDVPQSYYDRQLTGFASCNPASSCDVDRAALAATGIGIAAAVSGIVLRHLGHAKPKHHAPPPAEPCASAPESAATARPRPSAEESARQRYLAAHLRETLPPAEPPQAKTEPQPPAWW